VQRRRFAFSLVCERRVSLPSAAAIMGLSLERVRELVDAECDRRELAQFRCDSISVELTRSVIEQALAGDPELTVGRIAGWLEMQQSDFERAFLGRSGHGAPKRRVQVGSASRLMVALGRAPNELPGC
jgi:hypothetical protein